MDLNALTASDIWDAPDLETQDVLVPEWPKNGKPGFIRLHQLNAEDSSKMYRFTDQAKYLRDGMFIIVIFCARDPETGAQIFPIDGATDEDVEAAMEAHLKKLRKKSARVFNRLQRIALKLNRMRDVDEVTLKKDSSEVVIVDSPTASPVS